MLRSIRTLFVCTLYGGVGAALVRFLYVSITLITQGASRDAVNLQGLLLEPYLLREFTLLGAGGGLVFALLVVLFELIGWGVQRLRRPRIEQAEARDTDAILQADREQRAGAYAASRQG